MGNHSAAVLRLSDYRDLAARRLPVPATAEWEHTMTLLGTPDPAAIERSAVRA
ncbi:hypothetical protein [Catenulispora subtropica]|uniref:Uncharacterized protein n=1 Tax=Catenulispora subtropica TaxID=450798 RepID=A0ABP5ETH3_9ACTN